MTTVLLPLLESANFYLSGHPSIVNFRWSHTQSWGSTWSFLLSSVLIYIAAVTALRVALLPRHHPVPLGPIPTIHSLAVSLTSVSIFVGIILSAAAEIRETRWSWRWTRISSPFQWLLCFPVGTRPSGRVFFWSYVFYLSRFLHLMRTFFTILRRGKPTFFQLFNQSILLCTSFLWLEFSQSFQVMAILFMTLINSVVYGYRFWVSIGLRGAYFPFVVSCRIVLLGCNVVCHFAVLLLHFLKGGCNGIGAWVFNSVLNGAILLCLFRFYVKRKRIEGESARSSSESERKAKSSMALKEKGT